MSLKEVKADVKFLFWPGAPPGNSLSRFYSRAAGIALDTKVICDHSMQYLPICPNDSLSSRTSPKGSELKSPFVPCRLWMALLHSACLLPLPWCLCARLLLSSTPHSLSETWLLLATDLLPRVFFIPLCTVSFPNVLHCPVPSNVPFLFCICNLPLPTGIFLAVCSQTPSYFLMS